MNQRSNARPRDTEKVIGSSQFPRAAAILFVVAAVLVCLAYFLYTDQTWEDSLITLRHSENLLKGEGLTFNVGGRVHGFTSPINVLLLAFCHFATGQASYVVTLWLYRVFTITAFACGGVFLLKALHNSPPTWTAASCFFGIAYLFDVKTIAFTVNGMETGFMLALVAWAIYLLTRPDLNQWMLRGLCWGGLMWTRPDSCVYIAALSIAELVFLSKNRRATFVTLVKSAALCFALYAPWLIWAWAYYGSPIPHTIVAKGNVEQGPLAQLIGAMDQYLTGLLSIAAQCFRPIYFGDTPDFWTTGLMDRAVSGSTKFVGLVALLYFAYPVKDRFGRAMSLTFTLLCTYLSYMPIAYPWYFPPVATFGLLAFTRAATSFALSASEHLAAERSWQPRKTVTLAVFILLAAGAIVLFGPASFEERIRQKEVEMGTRAVVGSWLEENGKPNEIVYLEPLGYIGYFSNMRIDDFPGLIAPDVVKIRQTLPKDQFSKATARFLVIPILKPDWVVLRSNEFGMLRQLPMYEAFRKDYTLAQQVNNLDKLSRYPNLPGLQSLAYDANFGIFHRNPQPAPQATK
jgi:hypothetical protein